MYVDTKWRLIGVLTEEQRVRYHPVFDGQKTDWFMKLADEVGTESAITCLRGKAANEPN